MKAEVVSQFKDAVREWDGKFSVIDVYRRVANSPKRRYYVGAVSAYRVLSRAKRGDWSRIDAMPPLKREMYRSLYAICTKLERSGYHCGDNFLTIVSLAVSHPAPKMYTSWRSVQVIVTEHYRIKSHRNETRTR
jgi:hypothetical protein